MGFRYAFVSVPWQRAYLAIFAAFLGTIGMSLVIDTDHWRHFFLLLGMVWGLAAATRAHMRARRNGVTSSYVVP
jgi:hypothetical protein